MPAAIPTATPATVPDTRSGAIYTAIPALSITIIAAQTCPTLCITPPSTLTPTALNGRSFFATIITNRLKAAPDIL